MRLRLTAVLAAVSLVAALQVGCAAHREPAPLTTTPPMGWNSWNSGIELTEQNVKDTVDAMVSSGMRDAGYRYVNLDAGWAAPQRDSDGRLQADPARFPNGIAGVAHYAHDRGMRLGIYASPFDEGCSAQPALASAGHETDDAREFADWGVDYLKYDWCRTEADHDHQVQVFTAMRDALRATGRPIVYNINPNSSGDYTAGVRYDWSGIADSARVTSDLVPVWRHALPSLGPLDPFANKVFRVVPDQFEAATRVAQPSKPGYSTDPDMLVVGQGWSDFVAHHMPLMRGQLGLTEAAMSDERLSAVLMQQPDMTPDEQRTHLSLWALLSAPLIAGNDVRSMSPQTRDILTNRDVIAIDQDPDVSPVRELADSRVLVKPLSDGAVAVAFYNTGDQPAAIGTTADAVGLPQADCYTVRDLWTHKDSRTDGAIGGAPVPAQTATLLRVTPSCR